MKLILENWKKFIDESEASDKLVQNANAPLEPYVALLKQIADDPDFRRLALSGQTDAGGEGDEAISVTEGTPVSAIDLTPTQKDIDTKKSIGDQMTNKYDSTVAALEEPVLMPSPGGRIPILVFENQYILDGHHRWSQVLMTNPNAKMKVSNLVSPAFGTGRAGAERALKATQLAIAALAGNVVTKSTDVNLLSLPPEQLKSFVEQNISDDVLKILTKAGKISKPDRQIAGEYYKKNLQLVQSKPAGEFEREKGMPQADDSGVEQADVNNALEKGKINFDRPVPQDVKKAAE